MDKYLQEFFHIMDVSLRSGYNIRQSLEIICKDGSGPLVAEVQIILDEMTSGVSQMNALDHWLQRCPSLALDMVVATFQVQIESGGNLANKLLFVSQLLPKLKLVA
jgi:tight adherence protein C